MWRKLFQRQNTVTEQQVIMAAEIIAATMAETEPAQVAALMRSGFDEGQANRFVAFLPLAFSRPILEKLGIRKFSPTISVPTEGGGSFQVKLGRQPEFVAGLSLAREHGRSGRMRPGVFKAIVSSSADIAVVSNALNAGADVKGATITWSLIGPSYADHVIR
jgi:hypothetical protein